MKNAKFSLNSQSINRQNLRFKAFLLLILFYHKILASNVPVGKNFGARPPAPLSSVSLPQCPLNDVDFLINVFPSEDGRLMVGRCLPIGKTDNLGLELLPEKFIYPG